LATNNGAVDLSWALYAAAGDMHADWALKILVVVCAPETFCSNTTLHVRVIHSHASDRSGILDSIGLAGKGKVVL